MGARDTYPELVRMIRRLFDELEAHDRDYHHRTDKRLLLDVREFLVAVGERPASERVVEQPGNPAVADAKEETAVGAGGDEQ